MPYFALWHPQTSKYCVKKTLIEPSAQPASLRGLTGAEWVSSSIERLACGACKLSFLDFQRLNFGGSVGFLQTRMRSWSSSGPSSGSSVVCSCFYYWCRARRDKRISVVSKCSLVVLQWVFVFNIMITILIPNTKVNCGCLVFFSIINKMKFN